MFASLLRKRMDLVSKECLSREEQLESERHEGLKSSKRVLKSKNVKKKKKTGLFNLGV